MQQCERILFVRSFFSFVIYIFATTEIQRTIVFILSINLYTMRLARSHAPIFRSPTKYQIPTEMPKKVKQCHKGFAWINSTVAPFCQRIRKQPSDAIQDLVKFLMEMRNVMRLKLISFSHFGTPLARWRKKEEDEFNTYRFAHQHIVDSAFVTSSALHESALYRRQLGFCFCFFFSFSFSNFYWIRTVNCVL